VIVAGLNPLRCASHWEERETPGVLFRPPLASRCHSLSRDRNDASPANSSHTKESPKWTNK
jgi:hypothetical protein